MSQRYRTVAAFDVAYKADLVKAALEDAGIPAVVTDREIVSMEWLLANAVNGVKVQVTEDLEEKALAVVEALYRDGFDRSTLTDEELTRQALEAAPAEADPHDPPPSASADGTDPQPDPNRIDRDQYARRFMLCSVFSLMFPPLAFFAIYLGLAAVFGSGPMSSVGWQRVGFGVVFGGVLAGVVTWLVTLMF